MSVDTDIDDIVKAEVVVERWPARIDELAERVHPFVEKRRQAESAYAAAMREISREIAGPIVDIRGYIEDAAPSAYDLVD